MLRCDNSANLWGAPPAPPAGETESPLSPYTLVGRGRNTVVTVAAAAAAVAAAQ